MLNIAAGQRVTVWKVEDKGKYALVQMSSSRKDKKKPEGEQWINSTWSFVRFVGKAHDAVLNVEKATRIQLLQAALSNESYLDKEGNKAYPKTPQFVVFDFEFVEKSGGQSASTMDSAPVVAEDDGDTPY